MYELLEALRKSKCDLKNKLGKKKYYQIILKVTKVYNAISRNLQQVTT